MSESKQKDDSELLSDERTHEILENEARQLGYAGIAVSERAASLQPAIDVEIEGVEPASYAPASARPYVGTARRGLEITGGHQNAEAMKYLGSLFPGFEFSILGAGRHGIVMSDQAGKAYKLYRSALSYSRYEKEAGALKLLSEAGLAPKLHLFIDAGEEYRLDRKAYEYTTFGFEDVQIPRQNSGRELPVMVMDEVDAEPLENASREQLINGFCKTAALFLKENIHAWDMEVMLDKATDEVIILDTGGLTQRPLDEASATSEARRKNEGEILRNLCLDFGLMKDYNGIWRAYETGGVEAIRDHLAQTEIEQ